MTIEQKEARRRVTDGNYGGRVGLPLPDRDVRRKRPPLLSFLLRAETLRLVARGLSLLALDFMGVTAALLTALAVKLAIKGDGSLSLVWSQTRAALAFAYMRSEEHTSELQS